MRKVKMNAKASNLSEVPSDNLSTHPFTKLIYNWFKEEKLNASLYETKTDRQISWSINTENGLQLEHGIYLTDNHEIFFKSLVILGLDSSTDEEKIKLELLSMNKNWPCLYHLCLDDHKRVVLGVSAYAEMITSESYTNLINRLLPWADLTLEKLRKIGFVLNHPK